jgi:hypothetical protein
MPQRLRSQVLFAESAPGHLRLDGTLLEAASQALPAGSPVSLLLRLPMSGVVAQVVEATVRRWADAADCIDLEFVGERATPRVVLSDGVSTVRLEIEAGSLTA